ncbi:MAG: tetrahydrofolate dehydrogenase/cyclohydrolase catalytic domain-containing protein [Bacteroidales bacterium]|jgi:methylenetetrahydrofolate dehydrogenase (NADP+)/methenyltetrahydrofolate cyclohydrolase|nr:tetrahydrofolate dehydrogenase/cyclohydrolase catalytic domain-containing protein [Bacteroidales bacterium]HOL98363.1 tetrahydrofolate dehydrogenase/cyclohydrolase catalytic domain-containing protein [Bacteroidales bacterium]HOM36792.1 tetrahydrofolate dehydrogenase/cyclohydrolase catalytic domain-containing protein [Bacteroidales bacterium]HPD24638.1 tetrahydrofolate dehydrogenase/cyclohydrolase catalytic domain-containing protein [Bacteroidales bacterium]HRS99532.1 tetrahydrofolate dehydro
MKLIDGNLVASEIKKKIVEEALKIKNERGRAPHLAAILVGHDGGSESYVAHKIKDCAEVNFESSLLRFEDNITEDFLIEEIEKLNNNPLVDGFIVQLPLPKHINEQKIIEAINPAKDVDGFHPVNVGKMMVGLPSFISATPLGITLLLKHYNIETAGKHCVIIGRSNIVGRPLSVLMSQKDINSTVTVLHSGSKNIPEICKSADILIAAMGKPGFVTAEMVKDGAVVIDVGTTRVPSDKTKSGFKLTGDVDFENVAPKTSYITPVPGGVGPMTRLALLYNTLKSVKGF